MPISIPTEQIKNLQQIEAVVSGPDGANRLYVLTGELDLIPAVVSVSSTGPVTMQAVRTVTTQLGPIFTKKQFIRAIATAALTSKGINLRSIPADPAWSITSIDADWDDESGKVELSVELIVTITGANNAAWIHGLAFHVTILGEL